MPHIQVTLPADQEAQALVAAAPQTPTPKKKKGKLSKSASKKKLNESQGPSTPSATAGKRRKTHISSHHLMAAALTGIHKGGHSTKSLHKAVVAHSKTVQRSQKEKQQLHNTRDRIKKQGGTIGYGNHRVSGAGRVAPSTEPRISNGADLPLPRSTIGGGRPTVYAGDHFRSTLSPSSPTSPTSPRNPTSPTSPTSMTSNCDQ